MSYFSELTNVDPGSDLYAGWIKYALSFSEDDIYDLVENGMIHQATALRSMIREIIAGRPVETTLIAKLDKIVLATRKSASKL